MGSVIGLLGSVKGDRPQESVGECYRVSWSTHHRGHWYPFGRGGGLKINISPNPILITVSALVIVAVMSY